MLFSPRVTNVTCDGSVAKPGEHPQCSHFRSKAEVSFLPSANTRKRASASMERSKLSPSIIVPFEPLSFNSMSVEEHFCPQRPRSFWSAPRIATSDQGRPNWSDFLNMR